MPQMLCAFYVFSDAPAPGLGQPPMQPGAYPPPPTANISYPNIGFNVPNSTAPPMPNIGFGAGTNAPQWVPCNNGTVPPTAVVGGHDVSGEQLFVARANHEGAVIPGKLVPSHGVTYVAWGGRENPKDSYEVWRKQENVLIIYLTILYHTMCM